MVVTATVRVAIPMLVELLYLSVSLVGVGVMIVVVVAL